MQVFCDFDGTITSRDSIVFLTERFGAGPDFRHSVVQAIQSGEMTVFRAIELEMETVKATWDEAVAALRSDVRMTDGFPLFVDWCRRRNWPLTVLSSGLAPVVRLYLEPLGVPFLAHNVVPGADGWKYSRIPAHDKPVVLEQARGRGPIVFVGDGTSDVSALPFAEHLFARRGFYLSRYCEREGIPYLPFDDFDEVRLGLEQLQVAAVGDV